MKKILIASSALVAVAFAGQAQAGDKPVLSIGGEISTHIGITKQSTRESYTEGGEVSPGDDSEHNGVNDINSIQTSSEVTGSLSTTLDNGIEVGGNLTIDAGGLSSHSLYAKGGFGEVKFGTHDGAADAMKIGAPSVGPGGATGDFVTEGSYSNSWVSGGARTVSYNAPTTGGFSVGVSFADEDAGGNDATGGDSVTAFGVKYATDADGVSVAVAIVGEEKGQGMWHNVGAEIGAGNFTFGGSYGTKEDEFGNGAKRAGEQFSNTKDTGGELGVKYAFDTASFSVTGKYSETDTTEFLGVDIGFAYTLGAGVEWKSTVFAFDSDGSGVAERANGDNEGFGAVTGLVLSF